MRENAWRAQNGAVDIMVVDDSAEERTTLKRYLKTAYQGNAEIREWPSAADAFRECLERPPGLLLLDVKMPEMDGLTMVRKLREAGAIRFPIVMLTNFGDENIAVQALQAGAQDFLVKSTTTVESLRRAVDYARERAALTKELAETNDRLEAVYAQNSVGIAQATLEGRLTMANDAFCRLCGLPRGKVIGMHLRDLHSPNAAIADLRDGEFEVEWLHPDLERRWVALIVCTIRDSAGEASALAILTRDITARKQAEEDGARLASIVKSCGEAIVFLDRDGVIRSWNQGAQEVYGYTAEEMIGSSFERLIPADKLDEWRQMFRGAQSGERRPAVDTVHIRRDIYRVNVAVTLAVVRDGAGAIIGYSHISRDITLRKRNEEALAQSETRYRELAESMPEIVFTANTSGGVTYVNRRWAEYTGSPGEAALEYGALDCIAPEDRDLVKRQWADCVASGLPFAMENRKRGADGTYRWFLTRAVATRDASGRVTGWIGTSTDIHDTKMAEQTVRVSEERLRIAQSAAKLVLWDLDLLKDRYAEIPEFYQFFEFEPGTPVSFQDWLSRVHPDDRQAFLERMRHEGDLRPIEFEFRVVRRDGSCRWLLGKGALLRDPAGRPTRVTGVNIDITERIQAESELKEKRKQLQMALDVAGMGVWELERESGTIFCSERAAVLLGLPAAPVRLKLPDILENHVHPGDRERIARLLSEAGQGKSVLKTAEFRTIRPDGSSGWLETFGEVVWDPGAKTGRIVGVARDITNRKLLARKLAAAEKYESIGVLAGGLAHDFNNLLTGVVGSASLAMDLLRDEQEAAEHLRRVIQAGNRAATLTSQMLAYAGKGYAVSAAMDLRAVAADVMAQIRADIRNDLEMSLTGPDVLPYTGDEARVRLLLRSLITNAIEAVEGKTAKVEAVLGYEDLDQAALNRMSTMFEAQPGRYVRIAIRDNGSGIEDSFREKIFEPFYSTRFLGRGLGLAAVAGIVRAKRGAIELASTSGAGTTIAIYLPIAAQPPVEPQNGMKKTHSLPNGRPTILVVDSEEMIRKLAEYALARENYSTVTAPSGEAALDILLQAGDSISLVLLDATMPGMGGGETLRRIRRMNEDLPVILSSGYSRDQAISHVKADDISAFLPKPYTAARLLQIVRVTLDNASIRQRSTVSGEASSSAHL